jgi:hypothetical protein
VGCTYTWHAVFTGVSGRADMGRGSVCSAPRASACSVVGRAAALGSSRADLGLASTCALIGGASPHTVVGRAEARGSATGCPARALLERAVRPVLGRAREHFEAAQFHIGGLGCTCSRRILGCAGGRWSKLSGCSAVLGPARGAVMGRA